MEKSLELKYIHADNISALSAADRELIAEAQKATEKAYAAYSNFKVGAAVRLRSGKILHGANSESEVFPSGLCAERSVLYYVEANHADDPVEALAIASKGLGRPYVGQDAGIEVVVVLVAAADRAVETVVEPVVVGVVLGDRPIIGRA